MTDSQSQSALVKPFRSVFQFFGAFFDAVFYFFDTLINPSRDRSTRIGRPGGFSGGPSGGPRIGTLRTNRGNAPNMSMGCRSCQM